MPDYYWIILTSVAGGLVGYMIGALIDRKEWNDALEKLQDRLNKVDQRFKSIDKTLIEKENSPDIEPEQSPNDEQLKLSDGNEPEPRNNVRGLWRTPEKTFFERIKDIFSKPNKREIPDKEPKPDMEEIAKTILEFVSRLENIEKEFVKIYDEKKRKIEKESKNPLIQNDNATLGASQESPFSGTQIYPTTTVDELKNDVSETQMEQEDHDIFGHYSGEKPFFPELSDEIAYSYNLGVDDRAARNAFWENYPTIRIGNNKAIEQRLGKVSAPEFRVLDSGNFLAVEDAQTHFYLVVPQFDMTLTASAYNEGGVGFVFDFDRPDYNQETAYSTVKVLKPAVFQFDGENWGRIKKGVLKLQR